MSFNYQTVDTNIKLLCIRRDEVEKGHSRININYDVDTIIALINRKGKQHNYLLLL